MFFNFRHWIFCKAGAKVIGPILLILLVSFTGLKELDAAQSAPSSNPHLFPHKRIYTTVRVDDRDDSAGQIKIQSGFKYKVMDNTGLFLAYSISSLLDAQNKSTPFRDINHNPEIFLELHNDVIPLMDNTLEFIRIGYEHISNGVNNASVGPNGRTNRSRDIHNANIQAYFELRRNLWFSQKAWWNINKKGNEDIDDFYGNVDLTLEYKLHQILFTSKLRGNIVEGKGRIEFDLSAPITGTNLFWFAQYFDGYGETLLDYNKYTRSLRIGIMLSRK